MAKKTKAELEEEERQEKYRAARREARRRRTEQRKIDRAKQLIRDSDPLALTDPTLADTTKKRRRGSQPLPYAPPASDEPMTPEKLKQDMNAAFNMLGGHVALAAWGRSNPKEFFTVWARVNAPPREYKGDRVARNSRSIEDIIDGLDEDDDDE